MSAPLLVCCGLTTLDVVQRVGRVPGPDEKLVALGLDVTFGGPAANAAATAAALGVPTVLVTALGCGPVSGLVRAGLTAAGVRVVDLAVDDPGDPPVSSVLVTASTGQRAVVSTNATLRPDDLGAAAGAAAGPSLDGATALLVDGHHLAAGVVLAAAARERGIPVLLDGGSWKPGLQSLLAHVDVAVVSADFVVPAPDEPAGAAGATDAVRNVAASDVAASTDDDPCPVDADDEVVGRLLEAVAALGPGFVARSSGPGPVRLRTGWGEREELVPPAVPPGEVVDTLGAGDVLHGATGAALARGIAPLAALREGIVFATESVRHPGALGWAHT